MKDVRKLKLDELGRIDVPTFKNSEKIPVQIIVDNFRSGLNVGAIFRTADAFLIEKVLLCGYSSKPPHKEILKTAIGADHSVDWEYFNSTTEAIAYSKMNGYHLVGIEQTTSSVSLQDYTIRPHLKYAIVFGNEVEGVSQDCLNLIDDFIEIPQYGTKHSLNVAVCAGIVMYKFSNPFLTKCTDHL